MKSTEEQVEPVRASQVKISKLVLSLDYHFSMSTSNMFVTLPWKKHGDTHEFLSTGHFALQAFCSRKVFYIYITKDIQIWTQCNMFKELAATFRSLKVNVDDCALGVIPKNGLLFSYRFLIVSWDAFRTDEKTFLICVENRLSEFEQRGNKGEKSGTNWNSSILQELSERVRDAVWRSSCRFHELLYYLHKIYGTLSHSAKVRCSRDIIVAHLSNSNLDRTPIRELLLLVRISRLFFSLWVRKCFFLTHGQQ